MKDAQIIQALGGVSRVAKHFGISMAAVSKWKTTGIPRARLMYLRVLRPDLFPGESPPPLPGGEPAREVA